MKESNITSGRVYYDTGELYFEGIYDNSEMNNLYPWKPSLLYEGTAYYRNGNKYREGIFQLSGLLKGKEYYPSGALKFEGIFIDKHHSKDGYYYGPSYPINGRFYAEDGSLLYEGDFKIEKLGNIGYPKVVIPEGFGKLR